MESFLKRETAEGVPNQSPPPYTTPGIPSESDDLLPRLAALVEQDRDTGAHSQREVDRLRNFLIYSLSIDYQRNTNAALCSEDRQHYLEMSKLLNDLRDAHDRTHLTAQERASLAPYFWLYLHEPCYALGIPVESAAIAILRFFRFQTSQGRYKGSVYGVLHNSGLNVLAAKLLVDRTVLIPTIVQPAALQSALIKGLQGYAQMYFLSLRGIEGSTASSNRIGGWNDFQSVSYTLTERGEAYQARRCETLDTARQCAFLSPAHWASKLKTIAQSFTQRQDVFPKGKAFSDINGTWKGPEPPPAGTPATSHLWQNPWAWATRMSTHLPDFFEHRAQKDRCDA